MSVLYHVVPVVVFTGGVVAYLAAWRCFTRPERSGWWTHPWAGVGTFTFLATMAGPLMVWVQGDPHSGAGGVPLRCLVVALITVPYGPLLGYYMGKLAGRLFYPAPQPPPEPADPFERAVAAEERGDVRAAIERYSKLLDDEPAHVEARTRLGKLLARTRRFSWAVEVIEQGLALGGLSSVEKAGWKALLGEWEEGKLVEPPPGDVKREDLAIYRITTARITSRTAAHEEGGKDGPEDERPIEI